MIRPQVGSRSLSIFSQSIAILPTNFAISVAPHLFYCRPASSPPSYPSLLSRISATVLFRPERRYALRLVVVPFRYFSSPSPSLQPISPSPLSHKSSVAVPHLLRRSIHHCCPASPPPFLSAAVFTLHLVCHPYYPAYPPRLHCYAPASMLRSLSHYLPSFRVLFRRCLSTFSNQILFSLYALLYCTA